MSQKDKFDLLQEQYGGKQEIPNEALYKFLLEERENLINHAKLGVDTIPNSSLGKEVRRRCQTDLMWMAQYFTWITNPASDNGTVPFESNIFNEQFYGPFTKLFVKKDPSKPLNKQSKIKRRMLLWPRGGAKSTFDHVDTVQWILCFPAIRILYLTAEKNLAEGFVGEIKGHFYIKEDPTWMMLFWPEFCVEENKAGAGNEFTCPVYAAKKTGRKEPTVYASSVGKNKAGWRYELIKADDAVSDTNSETSTLCLKISNALMLAEKLLALGGYYIDFIGTRYADEDHYGILLSKNEGDITTIEGHGWVLTENISTNTTILVGKAIQIKPEVKEKLEREGRPVTYQEAKEEGCILLLPHLMSFSWCLADLTLDEKSFEGQRNQNPRSASQVAFDKAMLVKATIPYQMMPREGPCSHVWDLASSQKKGSDFTVGTSVIWGEEDQLDADGRKTGIKQTVAFVRKIVRDRMLPHQIVQAVIKLAQEEHPFIVAIENAQGASYLKESLMSAALRTRDSYIVSLIQGIDWFTPEQQKDAKRLRMGSLYPWITEGRFKFANYCMEGNTPPLNKIDIVYNEFIACMFDHHHDDIPDNLGYQAGKFAPPATKAILENNRDIFSVIDRAGWSDIYEPDTPSRISSAYYLDENGMLSPHSQSGATKWIMNDDGSMTALDDPNPLPMTDLFTPEPEAPNKTPNGWNNILGAGYFG